MEEESSLHVTSPGDLAVTLGEEEIMENWTFVNKEDAPAHELSDNCSEHESDSGSSIVVIESQSQSSSNQEEQQQVGQKLSEDEAASTANMEEQLAGADLASLFASPQQQCDIDEDDGPVTLTNSVDEAICFFPQAQEFHKEQSPYEVVEQPGCSLEDQIHALPDPSENPDTISPSEESSKCGGGVLPSIAHDLEDEHLSLATDQGPLENETEPGQTIIQHYSVESPPQDVQVPQGNNWTFETDVFFFSKLLAKHFSIF